MGVKFNWSVVPSDSGTTTIDPGASPRYDFLNTTVLDRIMYGEREYGINLVWGKLDPATPSIRVRRASGTGTPLQYGERFALHVRDGGYVRYGEREYGINLEWSNTPVYEWEMRGDGAAATGPVPAAQVVGLFNTVRGDFLFYDPRRYGINLKWLSDEGRFNDSPWYEDVGDFVSSLLDELLTAVKEALNRLNPAGIVDFVLSLLGILIPKRLRIRVVILRGTDGRALVGDDQLPAATRTAELAALRSAIAFAREVFKDEANTRLRAAGGVMVETVPRPSPSAALHVHCGGSAWSEDFRRAGRYFRRFLAVNGPGAVLGYAAPITVYIVDDVKDKLGCSLGPLTDYVTVSNEALRSVRTKDGRPSTIAHELGHACGLWHMKPKANLMHKDVDRRKHLNNLQIAIFRNSRHVTVF